MNDVRGFLNGVFEDLRARRLLPVAVLLVAALVAVPILLSKKAEEPSVAPVEPSTTQSTDRPEGPAALAQVRLEELEKGTGSSLSAFDESNPFAPPAKVVEAAKDEAGLATGAPTGGEVAPVGGGTTGTGDTGAGTDQGGGDTGDGGGDGGGDTKTTEFTYVIDVTFTSNGRERKVKGMEKLDVLPGPDQPLLIFMGVTDDGGNAVFLVDSTLTASGEGSCKPSPEDCAMVHVGPGSQEQFANDIGDVYQLRVDQIRKVKVEDLEAEAAASKKEKQGKTAKAAVGSNGPSRRFVPPILTDLLVVTEEDNSTGAGKRR
jgi:hypothetical protein